MNDREQRGIEIQDSIRQVLFDDWDLYGVKEICGDRTEYDHLIAPVYRILCSNPTERELVQFLAKLEAKDTRTSSEDYEKLRQVARKLIAIDVKL